MWVLVIVASVGLKAINSSQMAYGVEMPSSYFLISQIDTGSAKDEGTFWVIITESLSGLIIGGIGGFVCGAAGMILGTWTGKEDYEILRWGEFGCIVGYTIGAPIGVWFGARQHEKEGSFWKSLMGSILVTTTVCGYQYIKEGTSGIGLRLMVIPFCVIGSIIGYRYR